MKEVKENEEKTVKKIKKKKVTEEQFKEVIHQLVKRETGKFFTKQHRNGIEVGKKQVTQAKHSLIEKIIAGDKGRYFTNEENLDKIRTFIKSYLLSKFKK